MTQSDLAVRVATIHNEAGTTKNLLSDIILRLSRGYCTSCDALPDKLESQRAAMRVRARGNRDVTGSVGVLVVLCYSDAFAPPYVHKSTSTSQNCCLAYNKRVVLERVESQGAPTENFQHSFK